MRTLALLGAGFAASVATGAFAQPSPLAFKGAALGTTLEAWRTLAPPAGAGPTARPVCSNEPRIARIANNPLSAANATSGVVDCSYASVFGDYVLPHSVQFDPRFRARNLRYVFRGGKLTEIRFEVSADAYDDVIAWAKARFGPTSDVVRDSVRTAGGLLPRVRNTWRTAAGDIIVTDPDEGRTTLSVELSNRSMASTPTTAAAATEG